MLMHPRVPQCGGKIPQRSRCRIFSYTNLYTSPYAKTQGQWIARCVVQGFFTAPIEALPEITVTDVVCLSSFSAAAASHKVAYKNDSTLPMNVESTWDSMHFSSPAVTTLRQ